jgi:hypothetical protein
MSYDIIRVVAMYGYNFCGKSVDEKICLDSTINAQIKSEILSLQFCPDTVTCKYFPDVRRQIILRNRKNGSYKIVSYDTVCMEMNGELVDYNQRLADLIEELLDNHGSSAK